MSIFSTKQIKEFNPYSLLEAVLDTADFINNSEEELSYNAINNCPYPENYKTEENKTIQKIDDKLRELVSVYNDMDNQMIEFIKQNPVNLQPISDEEFTEFINNSTYTTKSIPFGKYLSIGLCLLKDADMHNIETKEELDKKINEINTEFNIRVSNLREVFFIAALSERYHLNYDTFRLAAETLKSSYDDIHPFINPAPFLNGDYWVRLNVMNFLSTFKTALYDGYKSLILDYNNCITDILRRE